MGLGSEAGDCIRFARAEASARHSAVVEALPWTDSGDAPVPTVGFFTLHPDRTHRIVDRVAHCRVQCRHDGYQWSFRRPRMRLTVLASLLLVAANLPAQDESKLA